MSFPSAATRLDAYQDFLIQNMMAYIDKVQDSNQLSLLNTRAFIQAQADKWLTDRESGIINANTPAPNWVVYGYHQNGFDGITNEELNELSKEIVWDCTHLPSCTECDCNLCQSGWSYAQNAAHSDEEAEEGDDPC